MPETEETIKSYKYLNYDQDGETLKTFVSSNSINIFEDSGFSSYFYCWFVYNMNFSVNGFNYNLNNEYGMIVGTNYSDLTLPQNLINYISVAPSTSLTNFAYANPDFPPPFEISMLF